MVEVLTDTIRTETVNIQDVDVILTIDTDDNHSSVVSFLAKAERKVYCTVNVQAVRLVEPVTVIKVEMLTVVVLELVGAYGYVIWIAWVVIVLRPELTFVEILSTLLS